MNELFLRHPGRPTRIVVGAGALATESASLSALVAGRTAFVITTPRVEALHGAALEPIEKAARAAHRLRVPEGEAAKTVGEAAQLWSAMLELGGKRDSIVFAFGGGSVGDLAGFAAGCFLRGVDFVQLPTTLLAQVDAAIGGKTAVDLPAAKNSVGLFHHPVAVVADTTLLATLPRAELRSGLVEVAKMGALLDPPLFDEVEDALPELLSGSSDPLARVATAGIRAKIGVVERDPKETGERKLLNFGHTLGHALETVLGYGTILHGDAVAHGIRFACRLAARRGGDPEVESRFGTLFRRMEIPALPDLDPVAVASAIARDKKAREGGLEWVLPMGFGRGERAVAIPPAALDEELRRFLREG